MSSVQRPRIGWIPTSTDFTVASARFRCLLPSRYLADAGWPSELANRREPHRYDVVVFQKIYDEEAIELARSLRARGTRTVFDLCDNHFYNPDDSPKLRDRAERLRRMLDTVDVVSVSTEPLRELVPGKETVLVDDVLDEFERPRPRLRDRLRQRRQLELVWYGNAGTKIFGIVHLRKLFRVLEELHQRVPLRLTVISSSRERYEQLFAAVGFPSRYLEWRFDTFRHEFARHDVCVIPIERNPFTLGKTANRVALSLKLGVPVIADSIPSFEPFREVVLLDEWPESLLAYARHEDLRGSHAQQGRALVEAIYTRTRCIEQWTAVVDRALTVAV